MNQLHTSGTYDPDTGTALVLTGGGARAAYQVGFLCCLSRHLPEAQVPIITGVSAGAINAVYLAAHRGDLASSVEGLIDLWRQLTPETIYRVGSVSLGRNVARWGWRLLTGGSGGESRSKARSLLDSSPLRRFLEGALNTADGEVQGIEENLDIGLLKAVALSGLDYSTGRTVTWIQGRDVDGWERPRRVGVPARLTINHIMASSALPLIFPAVRIGDTYFGDGGVRLSTPLAPAIHLGAKRILAISTRYRKSNEEARQVVVEGYPPPIQVAGNLMNAIFLDAIDQDARNLKRINDLIERIGDRTPEHVRKIDILVLRPSTDLGRLAADYEAKLPGAFRFLTRGLGARETKSPDFLSLLMFQPDYISKLIEIGEADAEARLDEIKELFSGG